MKQLLMLITVIVVSITSASFEVSAQNRTSTSSKSGIWKAYTFSAARWSEYKGKWVYDVESDPINMRITISNNRIEIDNKAESVYRIGTVVEEDNNYKWNSIMYNAIDEEGLRCKILLIHYKDTNITNIKAIYDGSLYVWAIIKPNNL